jgi:hypothetical protein
LRVQMRAIVTRRTATADFRVRRETANCGHCPIRSESGHPTKAKRMYDMGRLPSRRHMVVRVKQSTGQYEGIADTSRANGQMGRLIQRRIDEPANTILTKIDLCHSCYVRSSSGS